MGIKRNCINPLNSKLRKTSLLILIFSLMIVSTLSNLRRELRRIKARKKRDN